MYMHKFWLWKYNLLISFSRLRHFIPLCVTFMSIHVLCQYFPLCYHFRNLSNLKFTPTIIDVTNMVLARSVKYFDINSLTNSSCRKIQSPSFNMPLLKNHGKWINIDIIIRTIMYLFFLSINDFIISFIFYNLFRPKLEYCPIFIYITLTKI